MHIIIGVCMGVGNFEGDQHITYVVPQILKCRRVIFYPKKFILFIGYHGIVGEYYTPTKTLRTYN